MGGRATPPTLFGLAGLSLAACLHLGPQPDPSRFFTLTPLSQVEHATVTSSSNPVQVALGVGPINLPGYLDREQMVTRISETRIDLADNDRWAEPLEDNFALVLTQDLSALLQSDRVIRYPWPTNRRPTYQVEIEVLNFETDTARTAHLVARWILRDVATREALSVKDSRLAEPVRGPTTDESVAALSRALGDFSAEIADTVRGIASKQ